MENTCEGKQSEIFGWQVTAPTCALTTGGRQLECETYVESNQQPIKIDRINHEKSADNIRFP